jgi:hypothetical protein
VGKPQTTLTFGGDPKLLQKAAEKAQDSVKGVDDAVKKTSDGMKKGSQESKNLGDRIGNLGSAVTGVSSAFGDAAGSIQALADLQDRDRQKSAAHARALADVEQASLDAAQAAGDLQQANEDLSQSYVDAKQGVADASRAQTDIRRANLEVTKATKDLNAAIKEHGRNSLEAREAALDLEDAQHDVTDANIQAEQAQRDIAQAAIDGGQASRDAAQAVRDAKDAQMDLTDAQREANPPDAQRWANEIGAYGGAIQGIIGTISLLALAHEGLSASTIKSTAALVASRIATLASAAAAGIAAIAQGIWNVVTWAFPGLVIVAAIGAIVGAIIWIATQTTWFQDLWKVVWTHVKEWAVAAWQWIKDAAQKSTDFMVDIPKKLKNAFTSIASFLLAPFRQAFNGISDAWNRTIGGLRWSVPGWVPGIGGNSISAPRLAHFHTGGKVPGLPGQEMLAVLQAGETVTPAGRSSAGAVIVELKSDGTRIGDLMIEMIREAIDIRGGSVTTLESTI